MLSLLRINTTARMTNAAFSSCVSHDEVFEEIDADAGDTPEMSMHRKTVSCSRGNVYL